MKTVAKLLLCSLFLTAACGPEDDDPRVIPGNNGTNNGGVNNGANNGSNNGTNQATNNGVDDVCSEVECEAGRKCVKGVCVLADLEVACEDAEDLGQLDISSPLTVPGNTAGWADSLETSCADGGGFSGAEQAFRFTVADPVRIDLQLTSTAGIDWVIEVREDDCRDATAALTCSDNENFVFIASPNVEYWLIVEPGTGIDEGAFEIAMSFTELLCTPPGGRRCDGNDVVICQAGTSEVRYACGTTCQDGTCSGDTCDNPLVVTASGTYMGDTDAYTNTLNFQSQPTCSMSGNQGIATPGAELVLLLEGLAAGASVTIDTSMNDDNDNAIFATQSCTDAMPCLAGVDLGDVLEFDVPAAGDYFFIIDKLTTSPKTFFYTVDIQ